MTEIMAVMRHWASTMQMKSLLELSLLELSLLELSLLEFFQGELGELEWKLVTQSFADFLDLFIHHSQSKSSANDEE